MAKNNYAVGRDHNGRTCINIGQVDVTDKSCIGYIPMADGEGFQLEKTSSASWAQRYKVLPNYPIDKACQLFLGYCTILGATNEVLDALSQIITVTNEDRKMATSKLNKTPSTEIKGEKPAKKTSARTKTTSSPDLVIPPKKSKRESSSRGAAKEKVKPSGDYKSAAQMFQDLIMAGKLTDDEIFSAVKEQFGLDDKKRSYVGWYRNKLKKDGQTPPEAK